MRKMKLFTAMLLVFCAAPLGVRADDEEKSIVPIFSIKGDMPEAPDQSGLGELLGDKAPISMFDLLEKLRTARADEKVKGVIFDIEDAALGFAQIQELRAQFEALRSADKDVWVFAETLGNGTLLLGSSASKLVLLPAGAVMMNGMYAEGLYFKNMLDKIGVEADILHCGAYKSAGEPFYRTGPSKEAEEQTNRLIDSIFKQLLVGVAKSRKITPEQVSGFIDQCEIGPKDALEAKLVDKLQYKEDFIASLKKRYGKNTKFVTRYGKKEGPEIDLENPFAIFSIFKEIMKGPEDSDKPAIGVVFVEGPISGGEDDPSPFGGGSGAHSTTIRKAIAQAAADKNVKALLMRVDSPGGSAIASDIICEAALRFKKSGRPFIVSMGNVAGSGGYYVATLGDKIFAQPGTITGSIGVVGGKIITKGFWDWVGVSGHEYKRGKHADLFNTNRKWDDTERAMVEKFMNRVYGEFKDRVVAGRGKKLKGEIDSLAGGRVYTGEQAIEIGLIDELGGFADAIKYTAGEADLGGDYDLKVFPKPKNLMDILSSAFGGKEKDDEMISTSAGPISAMCLSKMPGVAESLSALSAIDPIKAKKAREFLILAEQLGKENVLLIGPSISTVMP
jgi:protease-4